MTRMMAVLIASAIALGSTAQAQKVQPPKRASVDDPIVVFNEVCYGRVPDVGSIRDLATKLAWQPIKTDDLKQFTTIEAPRLLQGWDAQVGERVFRIAIVRATPPQSMSDAFPTFKDGLTTTCTMVLDEGYPSELISKNMQTLARKEPISKDVDEGLLTSTTWAGGNEKLKVFLVAKVGKHGKGGLLSVTVLQK